MGKFIGAMVVTFTLAVGSHAEATCAWVLWAHNLTASQHGLQKEWAPEASWSGEAMCQRAKEDAVRRFLANPVVAGGKAVRHEDGDTVLILLPDGNRQALRYICLPDTVDPRGLKGGSR